MRHALTPPNLLTILRLALMPFLARAILRGEFCPAFALLAVAGATDGLDGYLARRFRWKSRLGAYLDPIADKTLLVTLYACLWLAGTVPGWLAGLVFGRDALILLMIAIAFAFTRIRDFPPSRWGKASTFFQIVFAGTVMARRALPEVLGALGWLEQALLWAVTAMAAVSGLHYVQSGIRRLSAARRELPIDGTPGQG
jgi:cardiolipin synthase